MPQRLLSVALGAALALAATPAGAQVIRYPARRPPGAWVTLSAGVLQFGDVIDDGTTDSEWAFATAAQLRASVERVRRGGTSYGLTASYARPSLDHTRRVANPPAGGGLTTRSERVDASASVSSVAALVRVGGGTGLHQVIEVSLGARRYSGVRSDADVACDEAGGCRRDLPPANGDLDFTSALGFGFGYPLGQRLAVSLVQDAEFTFHQRERGPGSGADGGIHRSYVTRLGVRYGLGTLGRGR